MTGRELLKQLLELDDDKLDWDLYKHIPVFEGSDYEPLDFFDANPSLQLLTLN